MLHIGERSIGNAGADIYLIAEIGQNHQGDINVAKTMILEAKKAGWDCVKFQKSCLKAKFTESALQRPYTGSNSWGQTYQEHKEYLEFTEEQFVELQKYAKYLEIDFTASAMDGESLQFLVSLNVPFIKIGSGDTNNFPMLEVAATLPQPLVISTGMQTMDTLDCVSDILRKAKKSNFAFLHCVSAYPTEPEACSLQMISVLRERYPNAVIGYSGHEEGLDVSKAAALLGAKIIERHFTLDKSQKGSDHKCSLEPREMQQFADDIRVLQKRFLNSKSHHNASDILRLYAFEKPDAVKAALGDVSEKAVLQCELPCKRKLGKSIVAAKDLRCGEILRGADVCIKVSEPNGIPAEKYYSVLGSKLARDVGMDKPLTMEDLSL